MPCIDRLMMVPESFRVPADVATNLSDVEDHPVNIHRDVAADRPMALDM
jgi:hypothetical protein